MHRISRFALFAAIIGTSFAAGALAQGRFPNIDSAKASLASALQSLERAPDRFGGHRGTAMRLIREAQAELDLAIQNFR